MKLKLPIIITFASILIIVGAFIIGRTTSNITINRLASSPYEKCMYQCMEGHTKTVKYCSDDLKDYIDNYDKYYSPYGVSSAFASKYSDPSKPNSPETGYKVVCFLQVVGCRKSHCKDYLNSQ